MSVRKTLGILISITRIMVRVNRSVLIHGYPLSGVSWEKQVPVLLDAGLPGHYLRPQGVWQVQQAGSKATTHDTFARDLHITREPPRPTQFPLVGFFVSGGGEVATLHRNNTDQSSVTESQLIPSHRSHLISEGTWHNPEGVDGEYLRGIRAANSQADRYGVLHREFFNELSYNHRPEFPRQGGDQPTRPVQAQLETVAAGASATASLRLCSNVGNEDFRQGSDSRSQVPTLRRHGDSVTVSFPCRL